MKVLSSVVHLIGCHAVRFYSRPEVQSPDSPEMGVRAALPAFIGFELALRRCFILLWLIERERSFMIYMHCFLYLLAYYISKFESESYQNLVDLLE